MRSCFWVVKQRLSWLHTPNSVYPCPTSWRTEGPTAPASCLPGRSSPEGPRQGQETHHLDQPRNPPANTFVVFARRGWSTSLAGSLQQTRRSSWSKNSSARIHPPFVAIVTMAGRAVLPSGGRARGRAERVQHHLHYGGGGGASLRVPPRCVAEASG